ncbi:MAG TPA: HNH endonuclease [Acidimicrobiales bacterium]|nr:HNH endonuclease [Acidimicrobiales bacterium]
MPRPICDVAGCERPINARGLCHAHYRKWKLYGDPLHVHDRYVPKGCKVDGCTEIHEGRGYCRVHRDHWRRYGDPLAYRQAKNGSGTLLPSGYRMVFVGRGYPGSHKQGQILEHRLVMAQHLGRPLWPDEVVHHRNGNRADNRIENLEVWVRSHPSGQRTDEIVAWARKMLERYDS